MKTANTEKNKLEYELKPESGQSIIAFDPVGGDWLVNHADHDRPDKYEIAEKISDELTKKYGVGIEVEIYDESGHAINDDTPSHGRLLAYRK